MMKKLICILLITLLCAALAACGAKEDTGATGDSATKDSATVSSAADQATEAPSSQTAETAAASSQKDDDTAVSKASDNAVSSASADGDTNAKRYATVEDYLSDPQVQESLKAQTESSEESSVTTEVVAENDTMVFEYTYKVHVGDEKLPSAKQTLDTSLEENRSTFEKVIGELKTYVDTPSPKVKIVYYNDDGSVITERTFE